MFIPPFRICKGNPYASVARPRRYTGLVHNVQNESHIEMTAIQPWHTNEFPLPDMAAVSVHLTASLEVQRPFWAF